MIDKEYERKEQENRDYYKQINDKLLINFNLI